MKNNGFTIIEIVVVAAILLAIFSGGISLMHTGIKSAGKGTSYLANLSASSIFMRQFERDIQTAVSVEIFENSLNLNCITPSQQDAGMLQTKQISYKWPVSNGKGISRLTNSGEMYVFCREVHVENLSVQQQKFVTGSLAIRASLTIASHKPEPSHSNQDREIINSTRLIVAHNQAIGILWPEWY